MKSSNQFINQETHLNIENNIQNDQTTVLQIYKLIRSVSCACDKNLNEVRKLIEKQELLQKINHLQIFQDTSCRLEVKKQVKAKVLSSLLHFCFQEFEKNEKELLFFAGATFNFDKLKELVRSLSKEELNQTRISDSVITFSMKYGDLSHYDFLKCMTLLIESGVDINKSDNSGKGPIDYVASFFYKLQNVKTELKKLGEILVKTGIYQSENVCTKKFLKEELHLDSSYKFVELNIKSKLFIWISRYKIEEIVGFKKLHLFANCDNGESTLLQFAANKSQNMFPVVEILLKKGANPNKVTLVNPLTPLEISARNHYEAIFKLILSWKSTKISPEIFNKFVKARGYSIKRELFGLFLESDKVDPTFVYFKTGNTPLHYAIRLCHKNAIQKLLKRPDVSLTVRNKSGKCPLDILNSQDLNIFLDSCLIFDNRKTIDFNSTEYKMQFRFRRLTDGNCSEVEVIQQIGKYRHLEHLLAHPLVHTYIMLKWWKVKIYFWIILTLQALLFLTLSVFFYRFPYSCLEERVVCFVLCSLNFVIKCWVFFTPRDVWSDVLSFSFKTTTLHEVCEILLIVTSIGSFYYTDFRAFTFIQMGIVFLLTAGYHPRLSHWSIMLQKVFRTFTHLLIFFSILMVAFATSFHVMFEDHRFFTVLHRSVFMSYFMTIGEINVGEVDFETTPFGGYLLFFLFAMSMSVVIINFWTGVAIRDIDKFEKRSEVNALQNVSAFIAFVERNICGVWIFGRFLPEVLLFPDVDKENYVVDCFLNKDDHFVKKYVEDEDFLAPKRILPTQICKKCYDKITALFYKIQNNTNEQKILGKLDKIIQLLEKNQEKKRTSIV